MKSPLALAQEIEKGCKKDIFYEPFTKPSECGQGRGVNLRYCEECEAKAQTLLDVCEWISEQMEKYDKEDYLKKECPYCKIFDESEKAIEICRRILK